MKLPSPEPGLVICYSYLWRSEQRAGMDEGRKDRPCVIVLAIETTDRPAPRVMVVPITHSHPDATAAAIELPPRVKQHLRLDDQPSWIIVEEVNQFDWPGFDLRPTADGRASFGMIPPALFQRIAARLLEEAKAQRLGSVRRD